MRAIGTIGLLIISNLFMTFAWYGHLHFSRVTWLKATGIAGVILISWLIALPEYAFQVPANRLGHISNGGPFNLYQLKTIQEVISLAVFVIVNILVFREGTLQWNHVIGFALIVIAVFVIFREW